MNVLKSSREKITVMVFLVFAACIGITFFPAIPQDNNYHQFADSRMFADIPNFWNVMSNVPFVLIGIAGLVHFIRKRQTSWAHRTFFTGILLTGLGSAYYHLDPNNQTLVWDRLPMTIAFMSFFSIIIKRYVDPGSGNFLLIQLILIGVASVIYWQQTEKTGHGDLRPYFIVQFLPMLLIPFMMLTFSRPPGGTAHLWLVLLAYVIAKFFETFDHEVFTYLLSGHTIKHFFAALAPLIFLRGERRRTG